MSNEPHWFWGVCVYREVDIPYTGYYIDIMLTGIIIIFEVVDYGMHVLYYHSLPIVNTYMCTGHSFLTMLPV